MGKFKIGDNIISNRSPTYFIADIAANHDGNIDRAFKLIKLAKDAGADAVKFQHFKAENIVSDYGFRNLGSQFSHQAKWKKSVFQVYQDASINRDWTRKLYEYCHEVDIDFFSSPYDKAAVEHLDPFIPAYKIGSGDITWFEMLDYIASKKKPVLLATGASELQDVINAVHIIEKSNKDICIMQCNTNYTGDDTNFSYISLNVLKVYAQLYPDYILGLSDHTPGHTTVLGAVALGARVIEKHFTDDNDREGPDHSFSMNPLTWEKMVYETRNLEKALGSPIKIVEDNETNTVVLQRRCIRVSRNLEKGHILRKDDVEALRPAPKGAFLPGQIDEVIGKEIKHDMVAGQHVLLGDLI